MQQDEENKEIDFSDSFEEPAGILKFKDEQEKSSSGYLGKSKLIKWTIQFSGGLIKNKRQATFLILIFVALAVLFSLFLIFNNRVFNIGEKPPTDQPVRPAQF